MPACGRAALWRMAARWTIEEMNAEKPRDSSNGEARSWDSIGGGEGGSGGWSPAGGGGGGVWVGCSDAKSDSVVGGRGGMEEEEGEEGKEGEEEEEGEARLGDGDTPGCT